MCGWKKQCVTKEEFWSFGEAVFNALHRIEKGEHAIMAEVKIDQAVLDGIATDVSDTADILQGILDSDTPLADADVTSLTAAVTKLKGVGVVVPVPVPVEPVPAPVEPVPPADPISGDTPVVDPGTDTGL